VLGCAALSAAGRGGLPGLPHSLKSVKRQQWEYVCGEPTGCDLVSIGERRRLARLLRAKRKEITASDAAEISLDESVTARTWTPPTNTSASASLPKIADGARRKSGRFLASPRIVKQRRRLNGRAYASDIIFDAENPHLID